VRSKFKLAVITAVTLALCGCATGQTRKIVIGMAAGAVAGAIIGHEFVHHGQYKQYETRNTIITSVLFALGTGAVMNWHYEAMEQQMVEVSGRYARYRLCNPSELNPDLAARLNTSGDKPYDLKPEQIGKYSISLDDNTKWSFPTFRKRFLQPDRGENQVISSRYIWEILRPGSFVTRSQNPEYFFEGGNKNETNH
jgi:hypothetical protein